MTRISVPMEKGKTMANKIIYILAIILMVVELKALVFLTWSWFDAKKKQKKALPQRGMHI